MEEVVEKEVEQKLEQTLDETAAKQFLAELSSLKQQIYAQGAQMNGLLLIAVRRTVETYLDRYKRAGLLLNESVTVTVSNYSKHASIVYNYSPNLKAMRDKIAAESLERLKRLQEEAKKEKENKDVE